MLGSVGVKIEDDCQIGDIIQAKVMYSQKLTSCVLIKYQRLNTESVYFGEPKYKILVPGVMPSNYLQDQQPAHRESHFMDGSDKTVHKSFHTGIERAQNQDPASFNLIHDLN